MVNVDLMSYCHCFFLGGSSFHFRLVANMMREQQNHEMDTTAMKNIQKNMANSMSATDQLDGVYVLQDSRGYLDKYLMFWKEGGGYTSDLNKAERFSKEAAERKMNSRGTDIPWELSFLKQVSRPTVDMQLLRHLSEEGKGKLVLQVPDVFSGNAIHFLTNTPGATSPDLTKARLYERDMRLADLEGIPGGVIPRSLDSMESIAFMTVNKYSIDRSYCIEPQKRQRAAMGM